MANQDRKDILEKFKEVVQRAGDFKDCIIKAPNFAQVNSTPSVYIYASPFVEIKSNNRFLFFDFDVNIVLFTAAASSQLLDQQELADDTLFNMIDEIYQASGGGEFSQLTTLLELQNEFISGFLQGREDIYIQHMKWRVRLERKQKL